MATSYNGTIGSWLSLGLSSRPNGDNMSICGWARLNSVAPAGKDRCIWATYSESPSLVYNGIQTGVSNTTMTAWFNGSQTNIQAVTLNEWFWWAFRANGTSAKAWIWTRSGGMVTISGTNQLPNSAPQYFFFGGTLFDDQWDGRIAPVKLFTGAMSDGELENEMWTILPNTKEKALAFWPMVGTTKSDNFIDFLGQGRTLTESGSSISVADGPPISWGNQVYTTGILIPGYYSYGYFLGA